MRIVIDTSVFVAAVCSASGASREVLRRCLKGRLEPMMGQALLAEYESVLARSEPFARSPVSARERDALWAAVASRCRWVRVYYLWRPNLRDEADNHVIEVAVAGGAEAIVTHNRRDFEGAELHFRGLRVLTPAQLLAED
ncbi:MAG: putative toxin-antitoxin system toxin component, PIN family [Chromatiales bacterium]|jgi:uncharacterized protein|nr:putative toxin-antitoxin system toxin component, PIN family [Chromatiales bacterium]